MNIVVVLKKLLNKQMSFLNIFVARQQHCGYLEGLVERRGTCHDWQVTAGYHVNITTTCCCLATNIYSLSLADRWHFVHTNSDFWLRKLICLFNSFFRTTTIFIGNAMQSVCLFKSLFNIYERDIFDIPSIHNVYCKNLTICSKAFFWLTFNKRNFASLSCCEWTWFPWTNDHQHRYFMWCNSTVCSRACSG